MCVCTFICFYSKGCIDSSHVLVPVTDTAGIEQGTSQTQIPALVELTP